jgi:hypothetical protein
MKKICDSKETPGMSAENEKKNKVLKICIEKIN